jgi:hypothetical protein
MLFHTFTCLRWEKIGFSFYIISGEGKFHPGGWRQELDPLNSPAMIVIGGTPSLMRSRSLLPAVTEGITTFLSFFFIFLLCGGPESAGWGGGGEG